MRSGRGFTRREFFHSAATAVFSTYATCAVSQSASRDVILRKAVSPDSPACRYPGLRPSTEVVDGIRMDRDVAVRMRDGITIYTDVYRPEGVERLPAIVAYSPYGKQPEPRQIRGVPDGRVSPMAKGEGPDPAYWCRHGYAVVNPDARGAYMSEGDIQFWGKQEGRDAHDLIEWVAAQSWCNSKVGMSGNSWLAVSQWFAAAEQPPHLAAIAPWQGFDDFYRDSLSPGGIPETRFVGLATSHLCGKSGIQDIPAMLKKHPLMSPFWEDKIADVERIEVPAYVVNTFNHFHSFGTLDAFRRMRSKNKWLRISNQFEWPDYYDAENVEDLRKFFDRYLLGQANGWEATPRVRLSVMNPGGQDVINRPETEFPLKRTTFKALYLDASTGKLTASAPAKKSFTNYESTSGAVSFTWRFDRRTEVTGYMKLRLWVQADGANDMDLFVYGRKLSAEGEFIPAMILDQPHPGSQGWLRVSHRDLDSERSTPSEPYLTHRREQLLRPGQIVSVDIGIWPTSMIWETGQQLEVLIAGRFMRDPKWFEPFGYETRNAGTHILHTGGSYDAHLLVPLIDS